MSQQFNSFEEFWPFYVKEHSNPLNRKLHFVGTSLAIGCAALSLVKGKKWLARAPLFGYSAAWVGHFFIEGNKPATFKHPLWSLQGDFKMWYKMLTGTMDAEVERVLRAAETTHATTNVTTTPIDPNIN